MEDPVYRLLARCARLPSAGSGRALAQAAASVRDWTSALARAEAHGVAPLLHAHLTAAGVALPRDADRALRALVLRHRLMARVRGRALREVLAAFGAAGVPVVVLKGAALAHLLYPAPYLRPMHDLDLLVAPADALRAQRLLADRGFGAPLPEDGIRAGHHLPPAGRVEAGVPIYVEVHHTLFGRDAPGGVTLDELPGPLLMFTLDDAGPTGVARALGHTSMLAHLCRHLRASANVFGGHRLIWVADIVGFAERFRDAVDWARVRARYPDVLDTLALLHWIVPLSGELRVALRDVLPEAALARAPGGVGRDFDGWPHHALAAQRAKGWRGILRDTLRPSAWWTRLHYGVPADASLAWCRWVRHPLHILRWVLHAVRH